MLTAHVQRNFANSLPFLTGKGLHLPDIVIVGSAALFLLGLSGEKPPADIDVLTKKSINFNDLKGNFPSLAREINGYRGKTVVVEQGDGTLPLDITSKWPVHGVMDKQIFSESILLGDIRVMAPKHALLSMREFNRPKDQERISSLLSLEI